MTAAFRLRSQGRGCRRRSALARSATAFRLRSQGYCPAEKSSAVLDLPQVPLRLSLSPPGGVSSSWRPSASPWCADGEGQTTPQADFAAPAAETQAAYRDWQRELRAACCARWPAAAADRLFRPPGLFSRLSPEGYARLFPVLPRLAQLPAPTRQVEPPIAVHRLQARLSIRQGDVQNSDAVCPELCAPG